MLSGFLPQTMGEEYGIIDSSIKSAYSNFSSSLLMAWIIVGVCLRMYPLIKTSSLRKILYTSFVKLTLYLFLERKLDHLNNK